MHLKLCLICLLILPNYYLLTGQQENENTLEIRFDPFKGIVYSLPIQESDLDPAFVPSAEKYGGLKKDGRWVSRKLANRYSDKVLDYTQIGEITLERINIPETIMGRGVFPGVEKSSGFGMILNSTMYIEQEGCYEFSLTSDDGSILWINHTEVVNNDGGHHMRLARDSVSLAVGVYRVKLWYFQGLPDRFGFIFDARRVGDMLSCDSLMKTRQYNLSSTLLFNTGKYTMTDTVKIILNKLLSALPRQAVSSIEITGHTDAVGSGESNQILSQKRAETIAKQCNMFFLNEQVDINSIGKGESQPKATNDTEAGREENRRVEITVILKSD